jgi:vancomycin resistance protein YoaR
MTSTSESLTPAPLESPAPVLDATAPGVEVVVGGSSETRSRRGPIALRFAVAFLVSLLLAGLLGTGAIYAYEQQYVGRVLPGVTIGDVDLSGVDRDAAVARLTERFGTLSQGRVVVTSSVFRISIGFDDFDRRADVEAMADAALAVGRSGSPVDRAVAEVRTAVNGVAIEPWVTLDPAAFASILERRLRGLELAPIDASLEMTPTGPVSTSARWGRVLDPTAVANAAIVQLASLEAPSEIVVPAELTAIRPTYDDTDVEIAVSVAARMTADLALVAGEESWSVGADAIRSSLRFEATPDGRFVPTIDRVALAEALAPVAKEALKRPVNATFLIGANGGIAGVKAGRDGRTLDTAATAERIAEALAGRAAGTMPASAEAVLITTQPNVTTAEAESVAPLMTRISTWTTYFPIGIKNGYGANIWIPSSVIDGYVLGPGETFDFWRAIGTVSYEKGYRDGGAIINGRTEPTGALAGGICSCSTTLWNAALRAGLKMGPRRNHYYYINRYPLGLDATVYKSGSGATANVSFTNDTDNPILIRGINTRDGNRGYVRFDLYSAPTGRKVTLTKPIVRDVIPATTRIQYTSALAPGARNQIEFAADGKKVWVSRTVRDAKGRIIHQETYFSHYKRVDGIILVGR